MIAACEHKRKKRHGRDRKNQQRWRCCSCGATWVESHGPKLLGDMRIDLPRAEMILRCLCEGTSVRVTSRLTNTDPHTILDLLVLIGGRCKRFMDAELRGVVVEDIQIDEVWQFIGCKAKTAERMGYGGEVGDSYCFTAIERNTKLLVAWHLGKRDDYHTNVFCAKLNAATAGNFQLSSDGYTPYRSAVPFHMGHRVEFGMLIKNYGEASLEDRRKYSPGNIVGIRKEQVWNLPDESQICTSHVERMNLNLRTWVRRMTRLSNGFSKKWENHEAMLGLFFVHYNYCRVHGTLGTTPAVATGLTPKKWSIRELLEKTATH